MDPVNLKDHLNTLSISEMNQFLESSSTSVSVGYLGGRRVHLKGYEGSVTFSQISKRIEKCYQKALGPTIQKVMRYNRFVAKDPLYRRPGQKDPIPKKMIWSFSEKHGWRPRTVNREPSDGSSFLKAWIPYPVLTQEEESVCELSIQERNLAHEKLNSLYQKSQIQVDTLASNSLFGKIQRLWDGCCDYFGRWKKGPCEEDRRDLDWIKSVQKRSVTEGSKAVDAKDDVGEKDESSTNWYELGKAAHKGIGILIDEIDQREAKLQSS